MSRLNPLHVSRRVLAALLVLASFGVVALAATPAGANPTNLLGPVPGPPSGALTITFTSPVTNLINGSSVGYHADATGGLTLTSVETKVCQHAYGADPDLNRFTAYNSVQFGYDGTDNSTTPSNDVRCVYQAGITGLGSLVGSNYRDGPAGLAPGSVTTGSRSILVGTGTVNWLTTNGIAPTTPLTCDATHLCDVVVKVGTSGPGTSYFIQPIQFAAVPTAPTALVATAGNGQVGLTWTAPGTGSPFTNYKVNVSPNPASGPCSTGTCLTGSSSPGFTVPNVTNFTLYSFTVQAVNVAGTGPVSNTATATPSLPGPTGLTTAPGDSQVLFSWSPYTGPPAATSYNVTVVEMSPSPGAVPAGGSCPAGTCPVVVAPTTSFLVTGLTNGHTYSFSVSANVPGGTTVVASATGTPNGSLIRQQINVDRPQGVLVISQYCSGLPQDLLGRFDPSNNNGNYVPNAVPNTLCSLTLSGPRPSGLLTDAITANARTVHDLVTHGTNTVESATATFVTNDLNQMVTGTGIPAGTRIATIVNAGQVTLTNAVTGSFIGGDLDIVGTTVNFGTIAGNTITPQAHGELAVPNEIEGYQIPGGSHITNVLAGGASVDISAPAMDQSAGLTVRIWTIGPTPAHLIENGPNRGQYFEAQGQIRQVMMVDTRDNDPGWSATGQVSQFCGVNGTPGNQCFSGDDLGWTPQGVHAFSQPVNTPDGPYTMAPTAGAAIAPGTVGLGTGSTTSADSSALGVVPGATLAYAGQGHGLGLAQLDANLLLWIPRQVHSGHYQATLTFTAI